MGCTLKTRPIRLTCSAPLSRPYLSSWRACFALGRNPSGLQTLATDLAPEALLASLACTARSRAEPGTRAARFHEKTSSTGSIS